MKGTKNCPLQGYRIGQTELKWKLGLSGLEARTSSPHPGYHIADALSTRAILEPGPHRGWWAGRTSAARNPLNQLYLTLVFGGGPTAPALAADVVPILIIVIIETAQLLTQVPQFLLQARNFGLSQDPELLVQLAERCL